ncbi:RNA polymerase sigma factor [Pontibacter mangrovi]|uniref:Sigma-70 family RNA polymerase sigma factor n=1 Tax=Pontibacter mangrovi TaxID=2589816 RepID=A0A501VXN0_9BACT|nr:sigma-70 family RNA polymerase sigma factor [Pontibacter mangrovi]TPE42483.1 sigma-70 family RNA polymerase sigma factor [Pontibacter mangrovi]
MNKKEHFTRAIEENEGLIYKVTLLYTDSLQDREDLYQEIVFQLWKSYDSFDEFSKLSTWMYRVAMNTAIYNLKKNNRKVGTTTIDPMVERIAEHKDHSEDEKLKLLHDQIQKLNLLEKGIILLYLEGKSHDEIAEIIGITTSNVGTKISRIKKKLKSQINKN